MSDSFIAQVMVSRHALMSAKDAEGYNRHVNKRLFLELGVKFVPELIQSGPSICRATFNVVQDETDYFRDSERRFVEIEKYPLTHLTHHVDRMAEVIRDARKELILDIPRWTRLHEMEHCISELKRALHT